MSGKRQRHCQRNRPGRSVLRASQGRAQKTRVLIVCEGQQTEKNYLYELKLEESVAEHFAVTVKSAAGKSRVQIVQFAVDKRNNSEGTFDEVWCAMDVEQCEGNPEHLADLRASIDLAGTNRITLYLSNPAFEVWLLAHFARSAKAFIDCSAVITVLNTHWRKRFKQDYNKSDGQIYKHLQPYMQTAITNAQSVRETHHHAELDTVKCNSSTDFYKLVKRLINPS